ncbi:PspC domain-containing protein [Thalassotalea sp. M1531]|uniref:PspC domain-containing protein n=1 Tax=Thalassotalea algicola TaxID=2716224 RepID=A0A7Y0L9C4_9GAMM|nr:PspC domain-containing protein [Thalassotalea algicola]NMP30369.1 PspC domain-containing protein [Thalassotalea algicola]
MSYERSYLMKKQLTKDVLNKKLSGVCAGIAKYYKLPRIAVRIAAILALITFPVAAGVAYIVAAMLLPTRA